MPDQDRIRQFPPATLKAFDEIRQALHADYIVISRCNRIEDMTPAEVDAYVEKTVGEMERCED
jgi:hypothetical protein